MAERSVALTACPEVKICGVCWRMDGELKQCGRCRGINYCSQACQQADWPSHKLLCKAFADTKNPEANQDGSIPGGGLGNYRRAIFFHPDETKPRIVWVDTEIWEMDLMQEGEGTPRKPFPEHFHVPVLHPVRMPPPSGNPHAISPDFYQTITAGAATDQSFFEEFTGLYITYRHWYNRDGSTENKCLNAVVRASGVEPDNDWKGPFVFRRPKNANIDMAGYRHLLRHLTRSPTLSIGVDRRTGRASHRCTLNGCPNNPRCPTVHNE